MIPIVSLIDIMVILLIFFVATTTCVIEGHDLAIGQCLILTAIRV